MVASNIRKIRIKKLETLKKAGVNPYPIEVRRTHSISRALLDFENLEGRGVEIAVAGRVRSMRIHGGSTFIHLEDGTGRIQAYLKQDKLGEKKYNLFLNCFDVGDFMAVKGTLFQTKTGEKTVEVSDIKMLTKSLLPLPEKWHGLQDVEERFRKRYLDLMMNPEIKEKFRTRSEIVRNLREILNREGFMEVETPILQLIPGGALARPFKTQLNVLKLDLYLRIAPELYLKQLLVGGFDKIYEIGRCFRNEGIDAHHNPDFTMLELYWAYQDRDGLMAFVEQMFQELIGKTGGKLNISYQEKAISFQSPWKKTTFRELLLNSCQIDIDKISDRALKKQAKKLGIKIGKLKRYKIFDALYKEFCLPNLIQPTFILDHLVEMVPLAKSKENSPDKVHRFQLVAGGVELINGFSELNDPLEQRRRFQKYLAMERKDENFLEALEYGMPPAAGLGMGIDRLSLLLTDSHSLREIILFPVMRPKSR